MKFLLLFFSAGLLVAQDAAPVFAGASSMDAAIEASIKGGEMPGAVVVVGHNGRMVFEKAYGSRALLPSREPMTLDTIFDAASLTKVVATTPSVVKLIEQGRVRLADPVTKYLPEFQGGKSDITVRQLMTHYSGLAPDVDLKPEWSGYETGIQKALTFRPIAVPGTRFIYSDINYVLLGEIVHRVTGKFVSDYAREEIFVPLGMTQSRFQPPAAWTARIAPTELLAGTQAPLRGSVHDPTARFMGGIAGHAGLFTTAADLARYCQMLLNLGELNGVRVLSPIAVQTMTSPQSPVEMPAVRGLGWDIDTQFSGNRGDFFPIGSYGHTGYTGTSLWIDPITQSYVILLTNRVHPHDRGSLTSLRGRVATIAAAGLNLQLPPTALVRRPGAARRPPLNLNTMTGLDVLAAEQFASLKGKHVGLITNHTGISRDGKRNVDLMRAAGVDVRAIFSPEHGLEGKEDVENIGHATDSATGLRVYSLYSGPNRRPNDEMLKDVDTLVFDIQDIGARFYTYTCTMAYAMEEAARRNLSFVVLDRPNPITGEHAGGPMIANEFKSFVGCMPAPVQHGMTMGELARLYNDSLSAKANLRVVAMENWRRSAWWDDTGLPWINPSPNMRSLNAALLYPGVAMFEYTKNYSVGRGTDAPFEQIGADWMDGRQLATYLNQSAITGVRVYPTLFTPTSSNFAGKSIPGVRFVITDRDAFDSTRFGLELAAAIVKLFPGKITFEGNEKLVGNRETIQALARGETVQQIIDRDKAAFDSFLAKRAKYLLY